MSNDAFTECAEAWEAHCAAVGGASNPRVYVQHESFDALCALGPQIAAAVVERWQTSRVMFWGAVLARVTGEASFGDGLTGDLQAQKRAWTTWMQAQQRRA